MECVFDMKLGASDIISLLALLVAGLSALYARWSWGEAKKANQISLLGHKKEIYDAFFELKMHMTQKAEFAESGEVSKFYYSSRNARIYFSPELAEKVEKYFDACFWVAEAHRKYGGLTVESRAECKQHMVTEKELAPQIDREIIRLLQEAQV